MVIASIMQGLLRTTTTYAPILGSTKAVGRFGLAQPKVSDAFRSFRGKSALAVGVALIGRFKCVEKKY
jgi:hypothetical protein